MKRLFSLLLLSIMMVAAWAQPTAIKDRTFFEGINYSWPYNAPPSAQQSSNLAETATNPDQIIAMLRTIYMNRTIPGNYVRGYSAIGDHDGTWSNGVATGSYPVSYPAIGTIGETNGAYGYNDAYGWGIQGGFTKVTKGSTSTVAFDSSVAADQSTTSSISKGGFKLEMTKLKSSTSSSYYESAKGANITITSLAGYEIIKVVMTCVNSGYATSITQSEPSGTFSTSSNIRTWTGSANHLILKNPGSAVRIQKIEITYRLKGSETSFSLGQVYNIDGYTVGTRTFASSVSADHSQGSMTVNGTSQNYNKKAPITITAYNLNRNLGYALDTKGMSVLCDEGNIVTSVKFTFDGQSSFNKINKISYITPAGETVEINSSSTPSISSFMNSSDYTVNFNLPAKQVTVIPSTTYSYVTNVVVDYKYIGSGFEGYFNPGEYTPSAEGNTVLLVEVKDGVTPAKLNEQGFAMFVDGKFDGYKITDYASLRSIVDATIKSVRVLTEAKRMGYDENAGTLFKIDADKLNRFFLLGKGQLRWFNNDYKSNNVNSTSPLRVWSFYTYNQPYFTGGSYYDQSVEALFGHMFEQFSPTVATGGSSLNDIYKLLVVNMESFGVVHDCIDVLSAESTGHEFNMYGKESTSDDCQDVRDMMFFVPDYRMLTHTGTNASSATDDRDPNKAQRYVYYNPDHAPKIGLFVIHLDEITEDKAVKVDGEDAYDVTLTWNSNLLDFLAGENGVYTLYRVTNDNGVETFTPVTDGSGNPVTITASTQEGLTYTDRVAQLANEGQTITYAVRGRDAGEFLSLQMSNKESVYIPGIDVSEDLNLKLKADYYSRFDPQEEKNNYSNLVTMGAVVSNITVDELQHGTLTFTRSYSDGNGTHTVPIAVGTVTDIDNGSGTMTIAMQNQDFFKFGYNSNGAASAESPNPSFTCTFTAGGNGIHFAGDGVKFYDNFSAEVEGNNHPGKYTYQVNFVYGDKYANSNTMDIYVHKTQLVMDPNGTRGVTAEQINSNDEKNNRSLPANAPIEFGIDVKYSSKSEILRYDAYRWSSDADRYIIEPTSDPANEQDVAPNGIAGNQGTYYTTAMNAVSGSNVEVAEGETSQAIFSDSYPVENVGSYVYAPVVEVFAPSADRSDYNTYGAPLQPAGTGNVEVSVKTPQESELTADNYPLMSEYYWEEANGDKYAYYNIYVQVDQSSIPAGYGIYKVRAWRKVDPSLLGEEFSKYYYRMGVNGEYLYEELDNVELSEGDILGTGMVNGVMKCTFGARKLRTSEDESGVIDEIKADFVVRVYFTAVESSPAGAPMLKAGADAKYYVLEGTTSKTFDWKDGVVTGVARLTTSGEVQSVTYYNVAGAGSSRPWQGLNIVVTRYSDGSTSTSKIVR